MLLLTLLWGVVGVWNDDGFGDVGNLSYICDWLYGSCLLPNLQPIVG
jgi:hypothetical protein